MRSFSKQYAVVFGTVAAVAALNKPCLAQVSNPKPPVAEWNFSEGTGSTAADSSGHGFNGTLSGGASWTTGIVGPHALHLTPASGNGSGSFLDIPTPVVDTSRSYTVSVWVRLNNTHRGAFQTLASIDGMQVSGFFLQQRSDGLFSLAVHPADDSSLPAVVTSMAPPESGVWYHVACVYNQAAETVALYVDGALQGTAPFTTPWKATGHTVIGRGKFDGKPTDFVDGDIDDVRFYDMALTGADILGITRSGFPAPTIDIDAGQSAGKVSPTLYGLMSEEINHSFEGGIYGELIQNRIFKDDPANPTHWSLLQDGGAMGSMALDTSQPVNDALTASLRVTIDSADKGGRVAVANDGYWGIPVKPDTRYDATVWAKGNADFKGELTLSLESSDGHISYASAGIGKASKDWKRYHVTLKTDSKAAATSEARFVIGANSTGSFSLASASLFPPTYADRANGNRPDILQKLADMKPTFLRFPGGNYLDGNSVADRFDWKKTIGPQEMRPGHSSPWGYRSSDGLGLLEFAEWCEDLHMEPLLAVYAGHPLRGDSVAAGPSLVPFVQDALDEIEYLTGGKSTHWGAQRIKDGHPEPFPLHYVEIGTEEGGDRANSYDSRFAQFYDAIKVNYPQLQLVATGKVTSRTPDIVDELYFRNAADMERHARQYDSYSRSGPKIAVGEWATRMVHESAGLPPTPNWECSLGDAAWLTGIERNSDIVVMESYAPLFVNVNSGAYQSPQNLIGYDAQTSFGSPSYWVQQVFGSHVGDSILHASLVGALNLYESVTQDSTTGRIYLKMVNTSDQAQTVKINVRGDAFLQAGQAGSAITIASASPNDTNSLTTPNKIVPATSAVTGAGPNFPYTFPPYSVTVLMIGGK